MTELDAEPAEESLAGAALRLHYLDWGGSGYPTILFVHGFALTAHTWDGVCRQLRDDFRCVALDLRGHGESDWAADGVYRTDDYVADLEAVAARLNLKSFVLVGHSLGGLVSLIFAARHPELLYGLVIVDTGPRDRTRGGTNRIRNFVEGPEVMDSVEDFVERALAFNPRRDRQRLRRSLLNNLRQTRDGRWTWKYDRRRRMSQGATPAEFAAAQESLRTAARTITCPSLAIHGAESDTYSDADASAFAAILPRGRLVTIGGAGHTVQGDRPIEFAAAVREFVVALDTA